MAMCTCALHSSMYCMYTCCSRSHEHEHNHSHTDAILKRALLFSLLVLRYTIFWTNVFLIWLVFKPANKCTHSHARALSVYVQLESVQSSKCENLYVEFKCTRVHTTYMHASAGLYWLKCEDARRRGNEDTHSRPTNDEKHYTHSHMHTCMHACTVCGAGTHTSLHAQQLTTEEKRDKNTRSSSEYSQPIFGKFYKCA